MAVMGWEESARHDAADRKSDEVVCARLTNDATCFTQDFVRLRTPSDGRPVRFWSAQVGRPLRLASDAHLQDTTKRPTLLVPVAAGCGMKPLP